MSNTLIIHDDSIISRTAYLIEKSRKNIIELEMHLSGVVNNLAWANVNREDIEDELARQRQLLVNHYELLKSKPVQEEIAKNIVRYGHGKACD